MLHFPAWCDRRASRPAPIRHPLWTICLSAEGLPRPGDRPFGESKRGVAIDECRRLAAVAMTNGVGRQQARVLLEVSRQFDARLDAPLDEPFDVVRERERLATGGENCLDRLLHGLLSI